MQEKLLLATKQLVVNKHFWDLLVYRPPPTTRTIEHIIDIMLLLLVFCETNHVLSAIVSWKPIFWDYRKKHQQPQPKCISVSQPSLLIRTTINGKSHHQIALPILLPSFIVFCNAFPISWLWIIYIINAREYTYPSSVPVVYLYLQPLQMHS